jgi:hypothetical protein
MHRTLYWCIDCLLDAAAREIFKTQSATNVPLFVLLAATLSSALPSLGDSNHRPSHRRVAPLDHYFTPMGESCIASGRRIA